MLPLFVLLANPVATDLNGVQGAAVAAFVDACTKGRVRFAESQKAEPIAFSKMPEVLRWWFRTNPEGSIYEFGPNGDRGYLIQVETPHAANTKICAVALAGDFVPGAYLEAYKAVTGQDHPERGSKELWSSHLLNMAFPEQGYKLTVRSLDSRYTVMSIAWYSDYAARVLKARLERSRATIAKKRQ